MRARIQPRDTTAAGERVLPRGVAAASWSPAIGTTDVVPRNRRFNPRGCRSILRAATPVTTHAHHTQLPIMHPRFGVCVGHCVASARL